MIGVESAPLRGSGSLSANKGSRLNIRIAYQQAVAREGLSEDPAQERIVERLAELQSELAARQHAAKSLLRRLGVGKPLPAPKGVYLWGGVGRGKTFLMDLFFQTLDTEARKRIHFHRMMREIHERLRHHGNKADPLSEVAQEIRKENLNMILVYMFNTIYCISLPFFLKQEYILH